MFSKVLILQLLPGTQGIYGLLIAFITLANIGMLGGGALYAVYFALCFAYPAGMGFGDVKLAGVLGMATAWCGWGAWAVGLFGGFLSGGLFGLALLATGRGGRKSAVPFGPFMLAGALLAVLAGQPLAEAYLDLTVA